MIINYSFFCLISDHFSFAHRLNWMNFSLGALIYEFSMLFAWSNCTFSSDFRTDSMWTFEIFHDFPRLNYKITLTFIFTCFSCSYCKYDIIQVRCVLFYLWILLCTYIIFRHRYRSIFRRNLLFGDDYSQKLILKPNKMIVFCGEKCRSASCLSHYGFAKLYAKYGRFYILDNIKEWKVNVKFWVE